MRLCGAILLFYCASAAAEEPRCQMLGSWKDQADTIDGEVLKSRTVTVSVSVNEQDLRMDALPSEIIDAAVLGISKLWSVPTAIDRANGLVVGPAYNGAGLVYGCEVGGERFRITAFRRYSMRVVIAGNTAHVSMDCEFSPGRAGPEEPWKPCPPPFDVGAADVELQGSLAKIINLAAQNSAIERATARLRESGKPKKRKK